MGKFVVGERYKVGGDSCETGNIIEITRMDRTWCYYKTVEGEHAPDGFMPNSEFGRALIPVTARKFKVGDKVIGNDLADENYGITCKGYKGIVTDVLNNGKIKVNHYTVLEECFDLFEEEEKIVITRKGKKTIAKYYINGKVMEKDLQDAVLKIHSILLQVQRLLLIGCSVLQSPHWKPHLTGTVLSRVTSSLKLLVRQLPIS